MNVKKIYNSFYFAKIRLLFILYKFLVIYFPTLLVELNYVGNFQKLICGIPTICKAKKRIAFKSSWRSIKT